MSDLTDDLAALRAGDASVDRSDRGFVRRHRPRRVLVPQAWCRPTSTRSPTATRCTVAAAARRRASSTSTSASLRVGDDAWLDCDPGLGAQLAASLNRFQIRVKAEVVDRTGDLRHGCSPTVAGAGAPAPDAA